MSALVHISANKASELSIVALNRKAILEYMKDHPAEPCEDMHCLRCPNKLSTYAICSACVTTHWNNQNYYAMGILKRTPYMQYQKKHSSGYNALADELAKSFTYWMLHST
jgi:hypothetical protein